MEWFIELDPICQAALAGGLTWIVTALGAALVFTLGSRSPPSPARPR